MKSFLSFLSVLLLVSASFAQNVPSPEAYLGYKVGTRYTRHHKIVEYFNAVAKARPDMVKLEQYGLTNEGRELMLAFVGTPENMQRLEAIRLNNMRLAGLSRDKAAPVLENAPAIVWLSYNVHGNEPSSSEAALLMIHALTDPANAKTKEWLKNTIVVIDPCINPDGRDRYVNWFNSMVGDKLNAHPMAREHSEPWPGGRSNHYNFDLNRDWAWQTQVETQQRLKKYNAWLYAPQIGGLRLIMDLPALLIVALITYIVFRGVRESRNASNLMVLLKLAVIFFCDSTRRFFISIQITGVPLPQQVSVVF